MHSLRQQLFRTKPIPADGGESDTTLKRSLGAFQLTMLGVSSVIGTGIFFVLSEAVPIAGPAVIWSFVIAAVVAGLCILCYAELASAVPVSGSSYSYTYAAVGELPAMGVAGCLLLEYAVCSAAVAVGWSQYVNQLFHDIFGFELPEAISNAPEDGGIINLPSVFLVACCAALLARGTRESALVNTIMVMIKVGVLLFFGAVAVTGWNTDHFADFAPFGFHGVMAGAGTIFFSFVGLDAVATAGDEAKNPRRTLPIALLSALVIITAIYLWVAVTAIGAQPAADFEGQDAGLAVILQNIMGSTWPGTLVAASAVVSIFSALMVTIYGQTRILYTMSKDGMMPKIFSTVNPKTDTPVANTVIVSAVVALLAALLPIGFLADLTSLGTLVAFAMVSISVIVLRRTAPHLKRGFKLPLHPLFPVLSVAGCIWILKDLKPVTWVVFLVWTAVILGVWFFTGRKTSVLAHTTVMEVVEEAGHSLDPLRPDDMHAGSAEGAASNRAPEDTSEKTAVLD